MVDQGKECLTAMSKALSVQQKQVKLLFVPCATYSLAKVHDVRNMQPISTIFSLIEKCDSPPGKQERRRAVPARSSSLGRCRGWKQSVGLATAG